MKIECVLFLFHVLPNDQAQQFAVNAGSMWQAVLACTQGLARSLPSLRDEGEGEGEAGPEGVAATLRQLPPVDPSHYPEYEPPLIAARQRLIQRRRAEEAVAEAQVSWRMDPADEEAVCAAIERVFGAHDRPLVFLRIDYVRSPIAKKKNTNCCTAATDAMQYQSVTSVHTKIVEDMG